jgi:hypothetical protein
MGGVLRRSANQQWMGDSGYSPVMSTIPQQPSPAAMSAAANTVTIGELEANYSMYCKAMRLLIREGRSLTKIQRTVCWQRLECLHRCLPAHYRDPDYLYLLLRREVTGEG